jgi:predicted RecA/RadA family phage recombinase
MKNFIQKDNSVLYTNAGSAISSGDVVVLVNRIGVAAKDIAATTGTGTVMLEGVYELAKTTGTAYAVGDLLFWDAGAGKLTKTATANTWAGIATESASSGATVARVALMPSPKQAAYQAASVASDAAGAVVDLNLLIGKLKAAGLMANS